VLHSILVRICTKPATLLFLVNFVFHLVVVEEFAELEGIDGECSSLPAFLSCP
jgi:hypothetical protein